MKEVLEKYCIADDWWNAGETRIKHFRMKNISTFRFEYMNPNLVIMKMNIVHNNGFTHNFDSSEKLEWFFKSLLIE